MRSKIFKSSPTPPPHRHSYPPCPALTGSVVHDMIESSEKIIQRWSYSASSDHCTTSSLFAAESREEAKEFISVVDNLQAAIDFLESTNASSKLLHRSQQLVRFAMKTLMKEFHRILHKKFFSEVNSASQGMNDLRSVAECMMNCGYSKECAKIFKTARKSIVDEALQRLGVDRLSLNLQFHKLRWEEIEDKIRNWLSATKFAVESIFSDERNLCDHVFLSSPAIRESCFTTIARDSALSLFGFPEQVASKCKKSPEKLFRYLDLYEAIQELLPDIDYIFSSESSSSVRSQVEVSMIKLGEAARTTLSEFESAIQKDSAKTLVTGGGVHPLTRYVMNYLALLANYTGVLKEILAAWPLNLHAPLPEEYFGFRADNISNVDARFIWLTLVLLSKLDRKSDLYKEVSLSYLFLANNLRYVVGKVRNSELRRIIGEDRAAKHEEKARQHAASYERVGWSKVIESLSDGNRTANVDSLERAKERFRKFNGAFLEVQRNHMEWVVADQKLREEIKESLARKMVPKYRKMYETYRDKLASPESAIVRYAPEDLENYLWGLLFGCSDGDSSSRRSRASTTSSYSCSPSSSPRPSVLLP